MESRASVVLQHRASVKKEKMAGSPESVLSFVEIVRKRLSLGRK